MYVMPLRWVQPLVRRDVTGSSGRIVSLDAWCQSLDANSPRKVPCFSRSPSEGRLKAAASRNVQDRHKARGVRASAGQRPDAKHRKPLQTDAKCTACSTLGDTLRLEAVEGPRMRSRGWRLPGPASPRDASSGHLRGLQRMLPIKTAPTRRDSANVIVQCEDGERGRDR
jgi:hypothetical protein